MFHEQISLLGEDGIGYHLPDADLHVLHHPRLLRLLNNVAKEIGEYCERRR